MKRELRRLEVKYVHNGKFQIRKHFCMIYGSITWFVPLPELLRRWLVLFQKSFSLLSRVLCVKLLFRKRDPSSDFLGSARSFHLWRFLGEIDIVLYVCVCVVYVFVREREREKERERTVSYQPCCKVRVFRPAWKPCSSTTLSPLQLGLSSKFFHTPYSWYCHVTNFTSTLLS